MKDIYSKIVQDIGTEFNICCIQYIYTITNIINLNIGYIKTHIQ